jgi:threonylcarbamoyladenosine tRNA methylthiotransferase MtaB
LEVNEVITFGCRLNIYEGEVIKDNLAKSGQQNVVVFNTCAVTNSAEAEARRAIRKYRKLNPDKKIIATGCAVQASPDKWAAMPEIDMLLGNEEKLKADSYNKDERLLVNDIQSIKETVPHLLTSLESKSRAFIQIQNGCNHRCTFCIIPYGRGGSRSVPLPEVINQIKVLVANGYNEVVLSGVDVSDYGSDLPNKPSLGSAIKRILTLVPELPRLRLSSIDVAEVDDELLEVIETQPRFMPHLHLSLQSGDDLVLKQMKRRHNRQQVIDFVEKVKKLRPDICFGADIIAGFPTETQEAFANSLDIAIRCEIAHMHAFTYSQKEGTPAARIKKQLPLAIRKERTRKLIDAGKAALRNLEARATREQSVIVENGGVGTTEQFLRIKLKNTYPIGSLQIIQQEKMVEV